MDLHVIAVDIGCFEPGHFADAQTGGVGGGEDGPVLEVVSGRQEPGDLLPGQGDRQAFFLLGAGDVLDVPGPVQGGFVEETEGAVGGVDEGTAEISGVDGVMEEDADLGLAESFQGLLAELGEALDVAEVEAAGVGAEVAEFHVGLVLVEQVGQEDHSPLT